MITFVGLLIHLSCICFEYSHYVADNYQSDVSVKWTGFKIIGDNIYKNVRPTYQRLDHQTESFHHFHAMAVQDRVDLTTSTSQCSETHVQDVNHEQLVLNSDNLSRLKHDFQVLLPR